MTGLCACMPLEPRRGGPVPTPEDPLWEEGGAREHLAFLSSIRTEENPLIRHRNLVRYLRSRMHEFMLQPALESDYMITSSLADDIIVMGYVAGRHPVDADSAVLVWTDVDLLAAPIERTGALSVAAMLESARRFAALASYHNVPERSMLFGVAINSDGHQALRQYFDKPTWNRSYITDLVYLGSEAESAGTVRSIADSFDIPLQVIEAPPTRVTGNTDDWAGTRSSQALRMSHALYNELWDLGIGETDVALDLQ